MFNGLRRWREVAEVLPLGTDQEQVDHHWHQRSSEGSPSVDRLFVHASLRLVAVQEPRCPEVADAHW